MENQETIADISFTLLNIKAGIKICNETTELYVLPYEYKTFCLVEHGHITNIPLPNQYLQDAREALQSVDNTFVTVFSLDDNSIITSGILNLTRTISQIFLDSQ
jgi:hypothetical protein